MIGYQVKNDFYIESLKSFYESYNAYQPETKLLIQHLRTFSKASYEINNNIIDRKQNILNKY